MKEPDLNGVAEGPPPAEEVRERPDFSSLWGNAWWAVSETWITSPRLSSALLALSALSAVSTSLLPLLIGNLADVARKAVSGEPNPVEQGAFWLGLTALLMMVSHASAVISRYSQQRLADELRLAISRKSFEHVVKMDLEFFEETESQDVFSRASQHQGGEFMGFVLDSVNCLDSAIQVATLAAVLIWIDPPTTLLLALLGAPLPFVRWRIAQLRHRTQVAKTTRRRWGRYYLSKMASRLTFPAVRTMGLGPILIDRFEATTRDLMAVDRKIYKKEAVGSMITALVFTAGVLLVIAIVGRRALEGALPFNLLVAYLLAAFRFRGAFVVFGTKLALAMEKVLTISHLRELLTMSPKIASGILRPALPLKGNIELRNVNFCYPGDTLPVLKDISLTIRPGETVALVGPNGAGKTTLAKLICRLYDRQDGLILVDGEDIRSYDLEYLYGNLSYVDQNGLRFEGTVHENIAYGDWRRLMDDPEAVRRIGKEAGIEDLVLNLPQGYETLLGRMFGSTDLSGGQWQRIAMARALARDSAIYVLDEPTAHSDVRSEFEVFSLIRRLLAKRTVILISHRFSSARIADRIIVMEDGRIVETGTHQKLLITGGLYSELFRLHSLEIPEPGTSIDPQEDTKSRS